MPEAGRAPWINIQTAHIADDFKSLLDNEEAADVEFRFYSAEDKKKLSPYKKIFAHKVILCSASALFRRLLDVGLNMEEVGSKTAIPERQISNGLVKGFTGIKTEKMKTEGGEVERTIIDIPAFISDKVFLRILEFLYTGLVSLTKEEKDLVTSVKIAAEIYELGYLCTVCENINEDQSELNPSIGTYLNDLNAAKTKQLFLNSPLLSDISFIIEGSTIYAHKALVLSRCNFLSRMLRGGFAESYSKQIEIKDVTREVFLAFLEYLYTDHCPLEHSDSVGILVAANRYGIPRLITLCELFLSKKIDVAIREGIEKADFDVIGLLLVSQQHNADQLAKFCLHFISTNYQPMKKRKEWELLEGDNLSYVEEHQWPPVSYLKALETYEKEVGGDKCLVM